jgi:hypothetical protein
MTPEGKQRLKALLDFSKDHQQFIDDDITYFTDKLLAWLPCFGRLSENRQIALIGICFNMGVQGFFNCKEALAALEQDDYGPAAYHFLHESDRGKTLRAIKFSGIILADMWIGEL